MPKKFPGTIANVPGVLYAHLVRTCRSVKLLQSGMRDSKTTLTHLEGSRPARNVASIPRRPVLVLIDTFLTA